MDKTRLVFYQWAPKNFNINDKAFKIHSRCLEYYSKIFDEIVLVIGSDGDLESVKSIERVLLTFFLGKNITIKVIENKPLIREAETLYEEVILKLDKLDGITFFAHSKGLSNIQNKKTFNGVDINEESIYIWICALYYLSLNFINEVKKTLIGDLRVCYGPMLSYNEKFWGKPSWQYNGGFFWLNTRKMYNFCKINNITMPICCDRTYAETLLTNIFPFDFNYIESHGTWYINTDNNNINPYYNSKQWVKSIMSVEEYKDFEVFYEKISQNL